jgi:hypothetical protein
MSPGAVSHIRAKATSGRSARPRTIICSTASRLCDSATANMTFCNDATSIALFLHVRDTFVKQLVQIFVHSDDLRRRGEPGKRLSGHPPLAMEVVVAQSVKHIHRSGPLQELRWEPCFIQRLTERRGRLLSLTGQITPLPGARLACLNARQVYQPNGNKKRTDRMRKLTWLLPAQKSKRENLWRLCGSTDQHIARKDPPIPSSRWASRPC